MSAQNLHRLAGALERLRCDAATGPCGIAACGQPSVGYIEGWDLHPVGVCGKHAGAAPAHGHTVHHAGSAA